MCSYYVLVVSTEVHTRRLPSEVVTQRFSAAHVLSGNGAILLSYVSLPIVILFAGGVQCIVTGLLNCALLSFLNYLPVFAN